MDILGEALGETLETVAAPQVSTPETQVEPAGGPARGTDGKFAKAADPAAKADPAPAGQAETQHAPITALLDERERRQRAEAELKALKDKQPAQSQAAPPSVFEDEQAFLAWQQDQIRSAELNVLEATAREKHGEETVDAAQKWFAEQPPYRRQELLAQRNTYEAVIKAHKRETALAQVDPDNLDEYLTWKAGRTAGQASTQTAAPVAAPPTPTRSLAAVPSAGGAAHVPTGPGAAFDQVFQ